MSQAKPISSGELERLISEDGVKGLTSIPSIFQKAIARSSDYDSTLEALEKEQDFEAMALYEKIVIEDIQAADLFKPAYDCD